MTIGSTPSRMRRPIYRMDADAVSAAALPVLGELRAKHLDHRWVLAWRSSQAFALNLFAGLSQDALQTLAARAVGVPTSSIASAAPLTFEWSDPADRLAESAAPRPHRTQVDVRLDANTTEGLHLVVLIEVKLTETDFGWCSALTNPANPSRDICDQPGLFGGAPDRCFQLANHGHGQRHYDRYLQAATTLRADPRVVDGGCWLRASLSQPMRNIALADMLLAYGDADRVAFAVCAPLGHTVIWRRFGELRQVFPDTDKRRIAALPAEAIARLHDDGGAELSRRYPPPVLQTGAF